MFLVLGCGMVCACVRACLRACVRVRAGACGSVRVRAGACGCVRVRAGACGCVRVRAGACVRCVCVCVLICAGFTDGIPLYVYIYIIFTQYTRIMESESDRADEPCSGGGRALRGRPRLHLVSEPRAAKQRD